MNHKYVVIDLDDTMCDTHHRSNNFDFDGASDVEWIKYHKDCDKDVPTEFARNLHQDFKYGSLVPEDVIVMSGRSDIARSETIEWLERHIGFVPHLILMRPADCRIKNEILKILWAESIGIESIDTVYDDNEAVVAAFEEKGVSCVLITDSTYNCNQEK